MTYTATLSDSPSALTTQAIVRLDPSPRHQPPITLFLHHHAKPEPTPEPQPGDEATLSHTSLLLARALSLANQSANAASDVRTQKIATLQYAIAADTYRVPSASLAAKLIETLQS